MVVNQGKREEFNRGITWQDILAQNVVGHEEKKQILDTRVAFVQLKTSAN